MNTVILGNLFSVLATGADLWGASRKSARGMLWAQSASQAFLGLSSLVLCTGLCAEGFSFRLEKGHCESYADCVAGVMVCVMITEFGKRKKS